jgi:L-threonylcarbamoyladenylate synthase
VDVKLRKKFLVAMENDGASSASAAPPERKAQVVAVNPDGSAGAEDTAAYEAAGARLREGKLVSFPTETVYGLGANALSRDAVLAIFAAKGRPLTDPLIVHVGTAAEARALVSVGGWEGETFDRLAAEFWPGPLTLVARAAAHVPEQVTANTGFVGVRVPAHPVAQRLLRAARVPVAAPSANLFGHVSPSSAAHVLADLGAADVCILDGGRCSVGVESTIVKIVGGGGASDAGGAGDAGAAAPTPRLALLRQGGIAESTLRRFTELGSAGARAAQCQGGQGQAAAGMDELCVPDRRVDSGKEGMHAPGGLLTHYAPAGKLTYILRDSHPAAGAAGAGAGAGAGAAGAAGRGEDEELASIGLGQLGRCCIVDFGGRRADACRAAAKLYLDLSADAEVGEAKRNLFDFLRRSEAPGVELVLLPDFERVENGEALADRCFRAASGKAARLAETESN